MNNKMLQAAVELETRKYSINAADVIHPHRKNGSNKVKEPIDGSIFLEPRSIIPTTEPLPYIPLENGLYTDTELSSAEQETLLRTIDFAEQLGAACHFKFHQLLLELAKVCNDFTPIMQYQLYKGQADFFQMSIITGNYKETKLEEFGITDEVADDQVLLVVNLPEIFEGMFIESESFSRESLSESDIYMREIFSRLRDYFWTIVRQEDDAGLQIKRLSPRGNHVPYSYYYVFSVRSAKVTETIDVY